MDQDFGINQAFVEELLLRYKENRATVSESWSRYFDRANGHDTAAPESPVAAR